jgi:hypothetical protein
VGTDAAGQEPALTIDEVRGGRAEDPVPTSGDIPAVIEQGWRGIPAFADRPLERRMLTG